MLIVHLEVKWLIEWLVINGLNVDVDVDVNVKETRGICYCCLMNAGIYDMHMFYYIVCVKDLSLCVMCWLILTEWRGSYFYSMLLIGILFIDKPLTS